MLTSIIRTVVPFLVALVGPWALVHLGVTSEQLSAVATVVVGAGYYLLARLLEQLHPGFGVLLGVPAEPTYAPADADRR